jgi:hypothetical protein
MTGREPVKTNDMTNYKIAEFLQLPRVECLYANTAFVQTAGG